VIFADQEQEGDYRSCSSGGCSCFDFVYLAFLTFSSTTPPEAAKVQGIRTVFFQRESLGDPRNSRRQIVSAYVYRVIGYDIGLA
jgi:hypothetical protein